MHIQKPPKQMKKKEEEDEETTWLPLFSPLVAFPLLASLLARGFCPKRRRGEREGGTVQKYGSSCEGGQPDFGDISAGK